VGYDSSWVEKLQNSIKRNVTLPYKFICLSDVDVPCNRIVLENDGPGFWAKMQLFKPNLFNGPVLYIDLDTVICKNIDEIILQCNGKNFIMWLESDKNVHSSALMYWEGDYSVLWSLYKNKPFQYWKDLYSKGLLYGDQAVVSENVEHTTFLDHFPKEWFHIAARNDNNLDLSKVKMLMFRKSKQKPSVMLDHALVQSHWK
jgi:alpha-N-acetylglucosamine transferase